MDSAPCRIGDNVADIETPALLVCLDNLEENLKRMKNAMIKYPGVAVRSHAKTHKCPEIARLQMKEGSVGVCCQKVTEAEAMVHGGVTDILLTNEVIAKSKLRRLASLTKLAKIAICVDNADNLKDISTVATEMKVNLDIVIEVNVGANRCGVEPGGPVVELARAVTSLPGVGFKGIQCYQGANQHVRSATARKKTVDEVVDKVKGTLQADGSRAVLDAGMKAVSHDSGVPVVLGYPELKFYNGGDEHGIVTPSADLKVGTKVKLIPGHCDPTVNLHNWIVGVRHEKVECVWPISARGPGI